MNIEPDPAPLLKLLREKLIPWAQTQPLILTRAKASELRLPATVAVSKTKKLGRRATAYKRRLHNNRIVVAEWPEDGQESLRTPMIWCVVAGRLDLRLGEYILHLREGDAVLIPPGVPHPSGALFDPPNEFADVLLLSPRGPQLTCWLTCHRCGVRTTIYSFHLLNPLLADDLNRITEELESNDTNSVAVSRHLLSALLMILQRELLHRRVLNFVSVAPPSASPGTYDPIERAQHYIRTHLYERLTLQSVAQAVRLSRSQFIVLFRERTGQSFVEYVTQLRLERACELLRETQWTAHYICAMTGFKAPAYFHRLFRRKMGMTPLQYRQNGGAAPSPEKSPESQDSGR
jgi:AraC-like DNA-binding protein